MTTVAALVGGLLISVPAAARPAIEWLPRASGPALGARFLDHAATRLEARAVLPVGGDQRRGPRWLDPDWRPLVPGPRLLRYGAFLDLHAGAAPWRLSTGLVRELPVSCAGAMREGRAACAIGRPPAPRRSRFRGLTPYLGIGYDASFDDRRGWIGIDAGVLAERQPALRSIAGDATAGADGMLLIVGPNGPRPPGGLRGRALLQLSLGWWF